MSVASACRVYFMKITQEAYATIEKKMRVKVVLELLDKLMPKGK